MGRYVYPFAKQKKRQIISAMPKFYLFDLGVTQALRNQTIKELKGKEAGQAFEQFILMELIAYLSYKEKNCEIRFWRTKTGLEVDFILGQAQVAIEVKISTQVRQRELKGLVAFLEEFPDCHAYIVSQDCYLRKISIHQTDITIVPWQNFLKLLWSDHIFNPIGS